MLERRCVAAFALVLSGCGSDAENSVIVGEAQSPIVGGYLDEDDKAVVGLAINATSVGSSWFGGHCSGTLIAPNLVLTARHCVALTQGENEQGGVVCGQTRFTTQGAGTLFRATTLTERPSADGPDFYQGDLVRVQSSSTEICGNDVALIVLRGAGIPASEATPLVPRIDRSPEVSETFSAVGYGLTSPSGGGGNLRMRIDDQLVSCANECGGLWASAVMSTEWVGSAPVCPGDSGGPALDTDGKVIGVVSRGGEGCRGSVYGDVASFREFIIQTALEAAERGGYEPPFWATTGSSTPPPEPPEPEPDPLGEPCTGTCANGYLCLSNNGVNGTCAPACSAADTTCPSDYRCDTRLGVCSNLPPANAANNEDDGGCTVANGPAKPIPWLVGMALFVGLARRRRR